jgi:hypothetical protein
MGLLLEGPIVAGDGERLRESLNDAIAKHPDHRMRIVGLDSPGGLLSEALAMAKIVHARGLATIVPKNATCVSACVLVFAAGNQKTFAVTAHIGVHGASQANGTQDLGALAATTDVAKIYAAFGVPDTVIARMVITAPEDISWLSYKDLMLFPNAFRFDATKEHMAAIGAANDGMSLPPRPTGHNDQAFKRGYAYGYSNYGGCEIVVFALHGSTDEWGDLTNGCRAGLDALRKEHQIVVPLESVPLTTTFGSPPPHTPALLREASSFFLAFKEGYSLGQTADCTKFGSLDDVCQTAIERRNRADTGAEPPLSESQIETDFGPKWWLDAYDWEYVHHAVGCGVMRAPSTLGCEAAQRDWPRKESSGQQ